ncbi:hypothetical protein GGR54DRAFT_621583 [Hypoxylon sp. NC1633]|nr:hypothetical protein GGR54DRAFT_621583 [Hypoxylon sp. NC1633]
MALQQTPVIPNLQLYTDEDQPKGEHLQLPQNSTRYQIVEAFVHLGLCLLESPQGRESLANTATKIVQERDANRQPIPHLYNKPIEEMPKWISLFLSSMRNNFPMTYLSKMEGEAMAVRQDGVNDMEQFHPRVCGYININRTIVNNMIVCHQNPNSADNYSRFKFQMTSHVLRRLYFPHPFASWYRDDPGSAPSNYQGNVKCSVAVSQPSSHLITSARRDSLSTPAQSR